MLIKLLQYLILISIIACSSSDLVSGGGADIGNPYFITIAVSQNDSPAQSLEIFVMDDGVIALTESDNNTQKYSTNDSGNCVVPLSGNNSYTFSSSRLIDGVKYGFVKIGIQNQEFLNVELMRNLDIELDLPVQLNDKAFVVTIPGIPGVYEHRFLEKGESSKILIDGVPQGKIPSIIAIDSSGIQYKLSDTLILTELSTIVVEKELLWESYTPENSILSVDSVYSVYRTSEGSLWGGTYRGGIFELSTNKHYLLGEESEKVTVTAIASDAQNRILCGTTDGLYYIDNDRVLKDSANGAPSGIISDIVVTQENEIWIGSDSGLYQYNNELWRHFNTGNSNLAHDRIMSILFNEQSLLIATFGGGVSIYDSNSWQQINEENSNLNSDFVYDIAMDNLGGVWYATARGVSHFDQHRWSSYTIAEAQIPHDVIKTLVVDKSNTVWAGTQFGLFTIQASTIDTYTSDNSPLSENHCLDAYYDSINEQIIVGTTNGISIIKKRAF